MDNYISHYSRRGDHFVKLLGNMDEDHSTHKNNIVPNDRRYDLPPRKMQDAGARQVISRWNVMTNCARTQTRKKRNDFLVTRWVLACTFPTASDHIPVAGYLFFSMDSAGPLFCATICTGRHPHAGCRLVLTPERCRRQLPEPMGRTPWPIHPLLGRKERGELPI